MTFLFANNARTTLAESLTATGTSISLSAGEGAQFPSPETGQMFALFITSASSSSQVEVCYCTARSSDTLTVKRGMDNTSAQSFSAGDYVTLGPVAGVNALFAQAGNLGNYSASAATAMGGYAFIAILADPSTAGLYWRSTVGGNTTAPGADGSSWTNVFGNYAVLNGGNTFTGTQIVPAVTDWTAYQAVGAKDADARYVKNVSSQYGGITNATMDVSGNPSLQDTAGEWHILQPYGDYATVAQLNTKVTSENNTVENLGYDSTLGYFFVRTSSGVMPLVGSIPATDLATAIAILAYDPVNKYLYAREAETGVVHTIASMSDIPSVSSGSVSNGFQMTVKGVMTQQFYVNNVTSTAQWVTFPIAFSGVPSPPTASVYGSGDQDTQLYGATASGCYVKCPSGSQTQGQPVSIIVMGPA